MTILITGGAGFIGSNTLIYLFEKYPDYKFTVLDALTYAGDLRSIPKNILSSPRFFFVYGDVRNAKVVDHFVEKSEVIIHFAAETHVSRSIYDDANFFETDVIGTQRVSTAVLNNKNKIRRFIHISTSEVYGTAITDSMDENHPLIPQSPYAAAKAGADRLVNAYYITYKIPSVIVRPFNMYGPRQHLEKVVPRFITSKILGEKLTIHGTGESKRDYTYVTDLARALDLIIHAPKEKVEGEIFNVGASHDISIKEIAEHVIAYMDGSDKQNQVEFSPFTVLMSDRPGQVFRHTANTNKIKSILGWEPHVSFEDGLRETIEWYKANREWWDNKLWLRHVPIETAEGKIEYH